MLAPWHRGINDGTDRECPESTHGRHSTGHVLRFASGGLAPCTFCAIRLIPRSKSETEQPPATAVALCLSAYPQELPRHPADLGEICRNLLIAAALTGDWMEAAARERLGRACAAKMDYRGKLPLLLRAGSRL